MARLCPLFSGSSGNSYYIGSSCAGILIDTGRTAKQLNNMLETCGIGIESVKAIFITHEHIDHIRGLRVLASRKHIPVYTSAGTLRALENLGCANGTFQADVIDDKGMECAGMFIQPFRTSHDCAESVGYRIQTHDGRTVGFSTDLGFLSGTVHDHLAGADLVVLESNHDVGMLKNGPYPYPLKKRILSDMGHLSNQACADELTDLAQKGTTRFVLAHLSSENNTPELAFQTALCSLTLAGLKEEIDFQLSVAPKENIEGKGIIF
ncbi:MBL fold metallo-hydrolase [Caproiciproducens faecalis]|uniref:MBL fold metallo-hydrolase n=1 Tax=Caproiciproducens faecalis TaxID=2820301 RepID=A0ABS7DQC1_9FIRM|nr:MBL fold metallo-hydrolase [Caproiciproducens faecalis]MBW7573491.1 MBL fold metallo-hydrolase [Caproiciproducens faecalis]